MREVARVRSAVPHLLCALALCASAPAPAAPPDAATVFGSWARSADTCKRPELVFAETAASINTDADGRPLTFTYEGPTYMPADDGLVTVELGRPHPYGKTGSKTALTFRRVSADEIGLRQAKRFVPFHRCSRAGPP